MRLLDVNMQLWYKFNLHIVLLGFPSVPIDCNISLEPLITLENKENKLAPLFCKKCVSPNIHFLSCCLISTPRRRKKKTFTNFRRFATRCCWSYYYKLLLSSICIIINHTLILWGSCRSAVFWILTHSSFAGQISLIIISLYGSRGKHIFSMIQILARHPLFLSLSFSHIVRPRTQKKKTTNHHPRLLRSLWRWLILLCCD